MKLKIARKVYSTQSTVGDLLIDGTFQCYTLEDPVRPKKIYASTAIPAGTYEVVVSYSPKFGRQLPLLLDVPGFEGVRIHPGNTAADTEGCLLVGKTKAIDFVGTSREAFDALFAKILSATKAGEKVEIEIVDEGTSPFMISEGGEVEATSKKGASFRVTADPLRLRSTPDENDKTNIVARLPFGHLVQQTGGADTPGWIAVKTELEGRRLNGFVAKRYLESVPTAAAVLSGSGHPPELFRVKSSSANLRKEAADLSDKAVIAEMPRGLVVAKVGNAPKSLWWEVETTLDGRKLRGFVHRALLDPDGGPAVPVESPLPLSVGSPGEVQVPESGLQLIYKFEGFDQPGKWPGGGSGVTVGIGYDLGFYSKGEFQADWGPYLPAEIMARLETGLGKTGAAAKKMAPSFVDIKIPRKAGEEVFIKRTLPKQKANTQRAFPGVVMLPPDAQGALVSLVYNRGTAMEGDRRREMREIRDAIAKPDLPMPEKLESIADSIDAMARLWEGQGLDGLIERRKAEAALVRSCV